MGRDPWSSGYGIWLMFNRSWVQISPPYTRWTWHFFTSICCLNCIVCLERPKINEKEARVGPFKTLTCAKFKGKKSFGVLMPDPVFCHQSNKMELLVFIFKVWKFRTFENKIKLFTFALVVSSFSSKLTLSVIVLIQL